MLLNNFRSELLNAFQTSNYDDLQSSHAKSNKNEIPKAQHTPKKTPYKPFTDHSADIVPMTATCLLSVLQDEMNHLPSIATCTSAT